MSARPTGLGRGLGALIRDTPAEAAPAPAAAAVPPGGAGATRVPVTRIRRSPW